jgi:hypothetical protein
MFGKLWIDVYDSVFKFLPISSDFAQPLKRSRTTFHRPQSTARSIQCEGDAFFMKESVANICISVFPVM